MNSYYSNPKNLLSESGLLKFDSINKPHDLPEKANSLDNIIKEISQPNLKENVGIYNKKPLLERYTPFYHIDRFKPYDPSSLTKNINKFNAGIRDPKQRIPTLPNPTGLSIGWRF